MQATKDYISLSTAKLLRDCLAEGKYMWLNPFKYQGWQVVDKSSWDFNLHHEFYPAYTWQEVLWEYPDVFFCEQASYKLGIKLLDIIWYLREKKYEKADKYFRDNFILKN